MRRLALAMHAWVSQVSDPIRVFRGLRGLSWYWKDYRTYRRMPGAERMRPLDLRPVLHERTAAHELDAHYFYLNAWAMRRLAASQPPLHVDVASQTVFASLASAMVPVMFVDGSFIENTRVEEFNGSDYACGMYGFRKPVK
ncbi:MAG: hypothetical protein ACREMQ_24335 [Longimicrobiales bacterium]